MQPFSFFIVLNVKDFIDRKLLNPDQENPSDDLKEK